MSEKAKSIHTAYCNYETAYKQILISLCDSGTSCTAVFLSKKCRRISDHIKLLLKYAVLLSLTEEIKQKISNYLVKAVTLRMIPL